MNTSKGISLSRDFWHWPRSELHLGRRSAIFAASLLVILVAARLALPIVLQNYVNRTLDRLPDYDGSVGEVTVHLIRGAYRVHDVRIVKTTGKVPVPYFKARALDFSIEWKALLHAKVVGEIVVEQGQLNFVNAHSQKSSQVEVDPEWLGVVKDLFPLRLNRAELVDSEIHFRDFEATPQVDVRLTHLKAVGTNFSNTRSAAQGMVAFIQARGVAQESGQVALDARFQPSARRPTFDINAQLTGLNIAALNDFLRAYAYVDAEGGKAGFYSEVAAREGKVKGYLKPIIKDLQLTKLEELAASPLKTLWESIVGFFAEIFTNQHADQLASKIPFEGDLSDPKVKFWSALGSIVRNAFVKALKPRVDNGISLESLAAPKQK